MARVSDATLPENLPIAKPPRPYVDGKVMGRWEGVAKAIDPAR
jgi:hypothetical protein